MFVLKELYKDVTVVMLNIGRRYFVNFASSLRRSDYIIWRGDMYNYKLFQELKLSEIRMFGRVEFTSKLKKL